MIQKGQTVYIIENNSIREATITKTTKLEFVADNIWFNNEIRWFGDKDYEFMVSNDQRVAELFFTKEVAELKLTYDVISKFDINSFNKIKAPVEPRKPRLVTNTPTDEEITEYQEANKEYNKNIQKYNHEISIYRTEVATWMENYRKFLIHRDGLEDVNEAIQNKVYAQAYDRVYSQSDEIGNSYSYSELANFHATYAEFALNIIEAYKKGN